MASARKFRCRRFSTPSELGAEIDDEALVTADLEIKYAGYFERERVQADRMRRMGDFSLDADLEYDEMRSLVVRGQAKTRERSDRAHWLRHRGFPA